LAVDSREVPDWFVPAPGATHSLLAVDYDAASSQSVDGQAFLDHVAFLEATAGTSTRHPPQQEVRGGI